MFHTNKYFSRLVEAAYGHPYGGAHELIRRKARAWIGLDKKRGFGRSRRRFVHRVRKAARALGTTGGGEVSLGPHAFDSSGLRINCFKTDTNSASIYLFGFADAVPLFREYQRRVEPGSVVVDVGANLGMHTLILSACTGPSGKVISYEPSPRVFQRLIGNLALNGMENVIPFNAALGSREGKVRFEDCADKTNIGKSHVSEAGGTEVPVTTLDHAIAGGDRVSLIKIDVEGYELEVLMGGQRVLSTCRPALILEFNREVYRPDELLDLIPYPIDITVLPSTLYEEPRPLKDWRDIGQRHQAELLLLPRGSS